MSGAAAVTNPRFKTGGTDWWQPPAETPRNAGIPYVVQIVEDAISAHERLVFKAITDINGGAKKQIGVRDEESGYVCDPGGYGKIAQRAGVCRKTAYNCVKGLIAKGLLREYQIVMRGKQRVKTIYFAPHFRDVLKAWHAHEALFHTALNRVVVRSRRKKLMTVQDAADFKMDPARAPKRGCGAGRSEFEQAKAETKVEPTPEPLPSDADLNAIREAFSACRTPASLKDAIDVLRVARAESRRAGCALIPAAAVADLMTQIRRAYKPSEDWPDPRPGWFLQEIVGRVAYWVANDWSPDGICRKCTGTGLVRKVTLRGEGYLENCECQAGSQLRAARGRA
jgi:hypothetical protein